MNLRLYQNAVSESVASGGRLILSTEVKLTQRRDPLGFSEAKLRKGEADVRAGRYRPLQDVVNELQSRYGG